MSYLCDLFFIFIFIMIDFMDKNALVLLLLSICFWMTTWMKNVNNFQIAKVQSQGVAYHLLDFLPNSVWRYF